MAWIESHQALQRHRKTILAAGLLKVGRPVLIGHLHCLWWWAVDNASSDGRLGQVTDFMLAEAAEWPSKHAKRFVEALLEAGFLERVDGEVYLHDWYDYAGKLTEQRRVNADRMRSARAVRVPSTGGARAPHVREPESDACGATEEDSRGEDTTLEDRLPELPQPGPEKQQPEAGAESAAATALAPPVEVLDRVNQTLTGQPGWQATTAQLRKLGQLATDRGLDLELEALKIADFMGQPKRRKDTQCTFRFVANWLERESPNGSGNGAHRPRAGQDGPGPRAAAAGPGTLSNGEPDPFAKYYR